jgi:ISXO2-like transposase domain
VRLKTWPTLHRRPDRSKIGGTYHHVSETHLHRYSAEFDFRYNHRIGLGYTDMQRAEMMAAGMLGKRLTDRRSGERAHQQA